MNAATTTPMRLSDYVAWKVRRQLADHDISAAELARRTGYKQPYLSRRMVGAVAWDVEDLQRIADALGIDVQELLPTARERDNAPPAIGRRARRERRHTTGYKHSALIGHVRTATRTDSDDMSTHRTARTRRHRGPIAAHAV